MTQTATIADESVRADDRKTSNRRTAITAGAFLYLLLSAPFALITGGTVSVTSWVDCGVTLAGAEPTDATLAAERACRADIRENHTFTNSSASDYSLQIFAIMTFFVVAGALVYFWKRPSTRLNVVVTMLMFGAAFPVSYVLGGTVEAMLR